MFGFFKKKKSDKPPQADAARYAEERATAQSGDVARRLTLAGNTETHQEILYYLAEHDPDPDVRRAVALNTATPVQASTVLAGDISEDVRFALAQRLVKLLPDLSPDRQSQLYAFAAQALGTLALDEVLKIRVALSSALKDCAQTPPKVAGTLAKDIEREVSEPILRFCTAVPDEDLLDILRAHPEGWAVQAIAGRRSVSALISRAVIDTDDRAAGVILLGNEGAEIGGETLFTIIEKARDYPEWQNPVAVRKNLPAIMAQKLAAFADASVRDILTRREDFDEKTIEDISDVFRRRLEFADQAEKSKEDPFKRATRLHKEGSLTESVVSDALAMRDREFVYAALARLANTTIPMVEKIFGMKAPKPVVALCWRAGLSMRMALQMQQELAQVAPGELIYPRGGTDYPLTEEELLRQLDLLGIKTG